MVTERDVEAVLRQYARDHGIPWSRMLVLIRVNDVLVTEMLEIARLARPGAPTPRARFLGRKGSPPSPHREAEDR